jgi:hypothetical protein
VENRSGSDEAHSGEDAQGKTHDIHPHQRVCRPSRGTKQKSKRFPRIMLADAVRQTRIVVRKPAARPRSLLLKPRTAPEISVSSADAVRRQAARREWSWESALALFPSWEWEPEAREISSRRRPPDRRFRSLDRVRI